MSRKGMLLLAVLVALAGCGQFLGSDGGDGSETPTLTSTPVPTTTTPAPTTTIPATTTTPEPGPRPDPDQDVLGWEDGYWHDDPIDVDQSDGLGDAELAAYVGRAKARVEQIRGKEFRRGVSVEIVSREEWNDVIVEDGDTTTPPHAVRSYEEWEDVTWEALFVVDEGTDATAAERAMERGGFVGRYFGGEDRFVVVTDRPETPTVDNRTLIHELVHALQDQHFDMTRPRNVQSNTDAWTAYGGLVEGEATLVEERYVARCGADWDCVKTPDFNRESVDFREFVTEHGMYVSRAFPYHDGTAFVEDRVRQGGWAAVDAVWNQQPVASEEQLIHPEKYPLDQPTNWYYEDRSRNGWELFDLGDPNADVFARADTLGEAHIFSMFLYQGLAYDNEVVSVDSYFERDAPYSRNYTSAPSAGWEGDVILPYRKDGEFGYYWMTAWESERDAVEFYDAYVRVLDGHGAERYGPTTWVIPAGGYADAFHVVRYGSEVHITNAPTVDDVTDIAPWADVQRRDGSSVEG